MTYKRRELLIYICIIAVQLLFVIYWAGVKTNYHVDELYSMGYARNFAIEGKRVQYITESPEFGFDKWINVEDLKKYLIVTEEERFQHSSFANTVREFATGRNYFGLLNIAESVYVSSDISSRAGVVMNIVFFVLADIALILLMKRLNMSEYIRYIALAMFGFSGYMISMVEYVRFYMLLIMLALVILNLFYDVWNSDNWRRIIMSELVALVLVYISFRNSELTMPFFGAFIVCFTLFSAITKRWKQFVSCVGVLVAGILYILVTTDYIGVLFRPDDYLYLENVWVTSSLNISSASATTLREYLLWLKQMLESHFFAEYWVFYLMLGVITGCVLLWPNKVESTESGAHIRPIRSVTLVSLLFWIAVFASSFIVGHGKAFSVLMTFVIAVMAVLEAVGFKTDLKKIDISPDTAFVFIILGEMLIYTAFEALCRHQEWRYYCYGFVSIVIVLWYIIDRFIKIKTISYARKPIITALIVFVAINALLPFKTRNIENMYEDEKAFVEELRNNEGIDVVLISEIEDGTISRHEAYDCVNLMPSGTKLKAVDISKYKYNKTDYPDEFVLWTYIDRDLTHIISDLRYQGYKVEEIGEDHCSKAYICSM